MSTGNSTRLPETREERSAFPVWHVVLPPHWHFYSWSNGLYACLFTKYHNFLEMFCLNYASITNENMKEKLRVLYL